MKKNVLFILFLIIAKPISSQSLADNLSRSDQNSFDELADIIKADPALTARVLKMTRAGVAWQAVGCARGAYESALKYTKKREQFGRPIASYQLIQNHLVEMLSNLTAMQTMVFRLSELQDQELLTDEHASLAKVYCSMRMRDVVSRAREDHRSST